MISRRAVEHVLEKLGFESQVMNYPNRVRDAVRLAAKLLVENNPEEFGLTPDEAKVMEHLEYLGYESGEGFDDWVSMFMLGKVCVETRITDAANRFNLAGGDLLECMTSEEVTMFENSKTREVVNSIAASAYLRGLRAALEAVRK